MRGAGFYRPTVAAAWRTGVQRAGHIHGADIHVAQQQNTAVLVLHRPRFDDAGVVDHRRAQLVQRLGDHDHRTAVGPDQLFVFHQRIKIALINAVADQAAVVDIECDLVAGSQQGRAERSIDGSCIAYRAAEQSDITAIGCAQRALVDDAAGSVRIFGEGVAAVHEIVGIHGQCRRHETADIDLRTRAEQHAIRIEDVDLTVGRQTAQQGAGAGAGDAVQGNRGRIRLLENQGVVSRCRQTGPVYRQALAALVDGGGGAGLADRTRAADYLRIGRVGSVSR